MFILESLRNSDIKSSQPIFNPPLRGHVPGTHPLGYFPVYHPLPPTSLSGKTEAKPVVFLSILQLKNPMTFTSK